MKKDEEQIEDVEFVASDEEGAEKSAFDKLKKLKEKIIELEKEKQEYLDGWQRARADYANLLKASDEEKKKLKAFVAEEIIRDLIPVIDSFIMAMANKEAWEKVDSAWRHGVEYIYQQLLNGLEAHKFTLFGEVGELFDPARYEAVGEEESDDVSKDHKIAKVIQKGFLLEGAVIRPARVVVFAFKK